MNNLSRITVEEAEPFEASIDVLFQELELAIRWQRPSTLFAIYDSEVVRAQAEAVLIDRISDVGHQVFHLRMLDQAGISNLEVLTNLSVPDQTVYFVDGLQQSGQEAGLNAFSTINHSSDYLVEKNLRIVFWLLESEAVDLTHYAPDCWALRHRVVEFLGTPESGLDIGASAANTCLGSNADESISGTELPALTAETGQNPLERETHDPRDAGCWVEAGDTYFNHGLDDPAMVAYQKALSIDRRSIDAWVGMGNISSRTNHLDEAVNAYREALVIKPDNALAWSCLGGVLARQSRTRAAITAFRSLVKLDPTNLSGWERLGSLLYQSNEDEQAVDAFKNAILLDTSSGTIYRDLGALYASGGDYPQARLLFERSLDFLPDGSEKEGAMQQLRDLHRLSSDEHTPEQDSAPEPQLQTPEGTGGDLEFMCEPGRPNKSGLGSQHDHGGEDMMQTDLANLVEVMDEDVHFSMGQHSRLESSLLEAHPGEIEPASSSEVERAEGMSSYETLEAVDPDEASMNDAARWNESGHEHLGADRIDDAIAAYLRAIELSQGANWPYINNLTQAYYRKGQMQLADSRQADYSDILSLPNTGAAATPLGAPAFEVEPKKANNPEGLSDRDRPGGSPPGRSLASDFEARAGRPIARGQHDEINFRERATPPVKSRAKYPKTFAGVALDDRMVSDAAREDQRYGISKDKRYWTEQVEILATQPSPAAKRRSEFNLPSEAPLDQPRNYTHSDKGPKTAKDWLERGNALLKSGQYDAAIDCYNNSLLLAPGAGGAYSNLALAYCYKEQYAEAIPLYQKSIFLLRTSKEKAISWNRLGDAYRRLNDQTNAAAAYRNAANLNPGANTLRSRARNALLSNAIA